MIFPVSRRTISLYKGEALDILKLFFKKKFIKGEYIDLFSKEFAHYCGVRFAVPTSTGRLALEIILRALKFPEGSEVILPAYEDLSLPVTIKGLGLVPVFVDIDYNTQNIDVVELTKKITHKTTAIIVAHLFGNPADIMEIKKIAKERQIVVIEDCAHAIGTKIDGKHVGTFGDAAFFSFHTTKPFMCFGGGLIATNNEELGRNVKRIIDTLPYPESLYIIKKILSAYLLYFFTSNFCFALSVFPLLNLFATMDIEPIKIYDKFFRNFINPKRKDVQFTNLQAFIGLKQISRIDSNVNARKLNASILDRLLHKEVIRPIFLPGCNYYFYIIFSKNKEHVRKELLRKGIDVGKNLMRDCPAIFNIKQDFPNTKKVIEDSIQIPIYKGLSFHTMVKIAESINKSSL